MKKILIMAAVIVSILLCSVPFASAQNTEDAAIAYQPDTPILKVTGKTLCQSSEVVVEFYLAGHVVDFIFAKTDATGEFTCVSDMIDRDGTYTAKVSEYPSGRFIATAQIKVTGLSNNTLYKKDNAVTAAATTAPTETVGRQLSDETIPERPAVTGKQTDDTQQPNFTNQTDPTDATDAEDETEPTDETAPETTSVSTLTEPDASRLIIFKGRLLDQDGKPLANKYMEIQSANWFAHTTTDKNGMFRFDKAELGQNTFYIYESSDKTTRLSKTVISFEKSTDTETYLENATFKIGRDSSGVDVTFQLDQKGNLSVLGVLGVGVTSDAPGSISWLVYAAIGAGVVLAGALALIIIVFMKKKRGKEDD